jgi:hypothetical protein
MKLLRAFGLAFGLSLALLLAPGIGDQKAQAQNRPLEIYVARLSAQDHYNSNGVRLLTVAGIIRQDRANYHEFGKRDRDDTDDVFFASVANRARLEALLLHGVMSPATKNEILNGTPLITVEVYENYVNVYVK